MHLIVDVGLNFDRVRWHTVTRDQPGSKTVMTTGLSEIERISS